MHAPTYALLLGIQRRGVNGPAHRETLGHAGRPDSATDQDQEETCGGGKICSGAPRLVKQDSARLEREDG